MERQFSQAQALISSQRANYSQRKEGQRGELTRLVDQPDSGLSPELSSQLRMYVTNNDDTQGQDEQLEQQNSNAPVVTEAHVVSPASNIPQASDHTPLADTLGLPGASERQQMVWEPSMERPGGEFVPQPNWTIREDGIWWSQDPSSLSDVFGSGFLLHDDMDDMY